MELRNVKTFIKVAELGNFSRASEELGYAQSTVTTQIQALENELHVSLFERNGKRAALSAAGREFLEYAYHIAKVENMALSHFSDESEPEGELRVGVMETICASRYGAIFKKYKQKYPKVKLKIEILKTLDVMEQLEQGALDVIITLDKKINRPHWICDHSLKTDVSFFCAPDHRFAGCENILLDEVLSENFIQIEEGCNYREVFESYVEYFGKKVNNVMEIGYTRVIIDAVANGLGVSLLPMFTLQEAIVFDRVSTFSIKEFGIIEMSIQVIHDDNRWVTPELREFINLAKEVLV